MYKLILIVVFLLFSAAAFVVLPSTCSLLSNDPGPFTNCFQDNPQLCCEDFNSVFYARAIFIMGLALALGSAWYLRRKDKKESPKIFG